MSADQRQHWKLTGELPSDKPAEKTADKPSTTQPASSAAAPADRAVETATPTPPASEPAPAKDAEARKKELAAEVEGLLAQRAKLRQELERPAPQNAHPPASQPAAAAKPDPTDYEKYPLGSADPQFVEDMSDWKAKAILATHQAEQTKAATEARQRREAIEAGQELAARTEAIKTRHPDFEDVAKTVKGIAPQSVMDSFILGSKRYGFDTLYHLGQHPAELARIQAIADPIEQFEELVLIGHALTTDTPPVKTQTDAPPPPPTLGTRASTVVDEAEAALARGDVPAYRRIMNEREMSATSKKK